MKYGRDGGNVEKYGRDEVFRSSPLVVLGYKCNNFSNNVPSYKKLLRVPLSHPNLGNPYVSCGPGVANILFGANIILGD